MIFELAHSTTGLMAPLATAGDDFVQRIVLFSIAGGIALMCIFSGTIRSMSAKRQQERTKREIAAYVAEGSMTPEEGERLIAAESKTARCCG